MIVNQPGTPAHLICNSRSEAISTESKRAPSSIGSDAVHVDTLVGGYDRLWLTCASTPSDDSHVNLLPREAAAECRHATTRPSMIGPETPYRVNHPHVNTAPEGFADAFAGGRG